MDRGIIFRSVLAAYNINDLYEAVVVSRDGFGDDGGRVEDLELRTRSGQVVTVSGYDFQWGIWIEI